MPINEISGAPALQEHPPVEDTVALRRPAEAAVSILDLIAEHRRQLAALTVCAMIAFAALALVIPKRYEATARLMPPDQFDSTTAMLGALTARTGDSLAAVASDALGLRTTGATIVGVLNSRTIQDDIITKFDLRKLYRAKAYESARKTLQGCTDISEDKKSGIISITVQDRDPKRAAELAGAYVDELNSRIASLTTSSARREREFLEERLKDIKQQLDESTAQLSNFSSRNLTFDPQLQGKAMIEAASNLQGQLIAAETELKGLEQIYGTANARVKASAARVAELRSKLRTMSGAQSGGGELYPSLEQLPLLGNTYYDLARQAKINETVYEVLTKQYELAKVQEAKEVPSIRVLDQPVIPERKVWPPRREIVIGGTLLVFVLGVLYYGSKKWFTGLPPDDPRRVLITRMTSTLSFLPLVRSRSKGVS